ncbi:MAG: DUF393 domain-containing protein [Pseudomonadota bacterium]
MNLTVYYDGACPLCVREIGVYRRLRGADAIDWVDAADESRVWAHQDLTRGQALKRLHARSADGTLHSGAAAFGAIWNLLPAFRWLASLLRIPGALPAAELGYRLFLRLRPRLQRLLGGPIKNCEDARCDA